MSTPDSSAVSSPSTGFTPVENGFNPDGLTQNYLDLFYSTLFHPVNTFKTLAQAAVPSKRLLFYALVSVALVSAINPIISLPYLESSPVSLLIRIPISTVLGITVWVFTALVVSVLCYVFTEKTPFRKFLVLSGLATLPWLFLGPVSLLKVGLGVAGVVSSAILGLTIWLWSVILFVLALIHSYQLSPERTLILLFMPFIAIIIGLGWMVGFIGNVQQLGAP